MNFQDIHVLIVGDVMLDQYWFGDTSRISQEAPVPVVHLGNMNECPGGAANVARGIKALGAHPILLGLVGEDDAANRLELLLQQNKIEFKLHRVPHYPTVAKMRVLSRNQQMIRLDTEKLFPLDAAKSLQDHFIKKLEQVDALILSDYGKGTLSKSAWFIEEAKKRNVPVIVDPKSRDFRIYQNADILTPNLKEFEAVTGKCIDLEDLVQKAQHLLSQFNLGCLVITRAEQGMSVITKETATHLPALAKEVFDVTGAGDTVIAVLATAIAKGLDNTKAAHLSNLAAGISVRKLGAYAVTVQEIQAELGSTQILPSGIIDEDALSAAVRVAKANGERIVFTNGCFDILHAGHILYLEQAKRLGDRLIIAVNTDPSVSRLKGKTRPINPLADRMSVLAGLRAVDWVVPFEEDTPARLIKEINPDILVKGGDYKEVEKIPGAEFVLNQGGKVQLLGLKEDTSTSKLIQHIQHIMKQQEALEEV